MRRFLQALRLIRRDDSGAAVLEFAIVVPMFFALLFGMYDIGMFMLRDTMLHSAIDKAGRDLRIDSAVRQAETVGTFRQRVCQQAGIFGGACTKDLAVEVTHLAAFEAPPKTTMGCDASTTPDTDKLAAGSTLGIMHVRVCIPVRPLIPTTSLGVKFAKHDGMMHLIASTVYRNE